MSTSDATPQPTQQDAMAVGQAAAAAAAAPPAGTTPEDAARAAVDREAAARHITLSDADKQQIARMSAEMASAMTVDQLRKAGALDPPQPPVQPATQPTATSEPGAQSVAEPVQQPQRKSWAERHGFR